ncbi:MAG: hypothetical protein WBF53_05110 [Litorimonas sp.]
MGKRSDFALRKADAYPTPEAAVAPLLPYLKAQTRFIEPCAGDGRLIGHLERHGHVCLYASDLHPGRADILRGDVLEWPETANVNDRADCFITNPPWTRRLLHPLILRLSAIRPTWLLLDAAWAFTQQAAPLLPHCRAIVTVGRVSWMGNGVTGKDDCAWYLFDQTEGTLPIPGISFVGKAA